MKELFSILAILCNIKSDKSFEFDINKIDKEYLPLLENEKVYIENPNKLSGNFATMLSELCSLYNDDRVWIFGYSNIENKEEFIDILEFELARLKKDREGIKKYCDKYLIKYPVYEDWLKRELEYCNMNEDSFRKVEYPYYNKDAFFTNNKTKIITKQDSEDLNWNIFNEIEQNE